MIDREAIEKARNVTLYSKDEKCQKIGREFQKFVTATQLPGLDWRHCSPEELNLLLIGFVQGTGAWPSLAYEKPGQPGVRVEYEPNSLSNKRDELGFFPT